MYKYLLLIVVCSPLGYVLYRDGLPVLDYYLFGNKSSREKDLDRQQQELAARRNELGNITSISPQIHQVILRSETDCPPPGEGAGTAEQQLVNSIKGHGDQLRNLDNLFQSVAALRQDPLKWKNPFAAGDTYHQWLEERKVLAQSEATIISDLKKLTNQYEVALANDLQGRMEQYSKQPGASLLFQESTRLALEKARLIHATRLIPILKPLAEALTRKDFRQGMDLMRTEVKGLIAELQKFRKDHAGHPDADEWAKTQMTQWQEVFKKLEDVQVNPVSNSSQFTERMSRLAGLVELPSLPNEFHDLVKQLRLQFCEGYLPVQNLNELKDLEDQVLLTRDKISVPRSKVVIKWTDEEAQKRKEPLTLLVNSGYTEFNLPMDRVVRFIIESTTYEKPLAPTAHNAALKDYIDQRVKLNWTLTDMQQLQKMFENSPHLNKFADLLQRIRTIIQTMQMYPKLFV